MVDKTKGLVKNMSNLGAYQWLTTTAKKVGGPKKLVLVIAVTGVAVYKGSEVLVKKGVKVVKDKYADRKMIATSNIKTYVVKTPGVSNEGLSFRVGEQFKVLQSVGDAVLVEKLGDANNPYFVSMNLLKEISDYKN